MNQSPQQSQRDVLFYYPRNLIGALKMMRKLSVYMIFGAKLFMRA